MRVAWAGVAAALVLGVMGPMARAAAKTPPVLQRIVDVPLPGASSRFDYTSADTAANRLYLSHMGAGTLVVCDLRARAVVDTVAELPRVTGVSAVPSLGKVYASCPGRHDVAVIDARTLRIEARVGPVGFPDGIAYAPDVGKIYVSDESGGGELVIDGATDRVVTTIDVGGEAGNTLYDSVAKRIWVAVQARDEIVEIDPVHDRIVARHALAGSSHPHGMALDALARVLFVASEESAIVQAVDLRTFRVVARQPVGDDPDVLAFDPAWRRLYVASESGVVAAFGVRDGALVPEGRVVMSHAHTLWVDPRTHRVYLPLQDVGGRPVLRIMSARRP